MSEIFIRKALMEDMETLLQFEQGVITAERPMAKNLKDDAITYYDLPKLINDDGSELLVVEDKGNLLACGYARIETARDCQKYPYYAYLGFMYVEPDSRGQGINQLLMTALQAWAKTQGVCEFRLDVYADNAAAIRAYEKAGFIQHKLEMQLVIE